MNTNFITQIIDADIAAGKKKVRTRFPPEPNGHLHIGHAKSICLNFGVARQYKGLCNLRFDDTNPETENQEYADSIIRDIKWLGFDWGKRIFYTSDYFGKLYEYAAELIKREKAYVCDLSAEEVREYRGTIKKPGKDSPYRNRTKEENIDLFRRMKDGGFEDGSRTLRAKIDMSSPHMLMRDAPLYRIKKKAHFRTGEKWCIYPTYDFAHCLSDSIEGITHSLCTLEFETHRLLYNWILEALGAHLPQQIEFARLNISHTVLSKRCLLELVRKGDVTGWDDPRMPTLSGLKRRGYTPASIRNFCDRIGITKTDSTIDLVVLENSIREELNKTAPRRMAVLRPLKIVITNYPEGKSEELDAVNNPEKPEAGTRKIPFSRELYIERNDFLENPPKKFFRLAPGREVRLRYAYFIKCTDVIKDKETGDVKELHCTYDSGTKGGNAPDGRKVKATLHWVSARHAIGGEVRLCEAAPGCRFEPGLKNAKPGERFQFERQGYFCVDTESAPGKLIFNRTATLRDTWAKIQKTWK